ncbi:ABC transporter permease [Sulfurospirillum oryzae]|uniref:ABC transporter permease n=1 Tax=Sulfurospirillum oryzae TaxID=2976535 RepID=UPI0021E75854|nr:ABC transporter permease [Sulfurospirillum oryzae]
MRHKFTIILVLLGLIMLFFLTAPLFKMLIGNDVGTLLKTIQEADVSASVILTMKVSLFSTMFALFTGLPLAYLIARYEFFGRSFLETLVDIPIMIPHTAAGIALLVAFGSGYIGEFFSGLGIKFIGTEAGIMIAMMFLSATFLINGAKEGFKKVDVKLEKVARTLGASPMHVFFAISVPNAKKDIVNGCLMMWGRGLGEFGAVVILVYHPMTAPVLIYDRFTSFGLSYSAPVAGVMIILSILVFLTVRFINNRLR